MIILREGDDFFYYSNGNICMDTLQAISPIDGRYRFICDPLAHYFSEYALMCYRVRIECEYLIALSLHPNIGARIFREEEVSFLREMYRLSEQDARLIKQIEITGWQDIEATRHDVKAVEYFIKLKIGETSLRDAREWVHFALTSEDVNNIAYSLMLRDCLENILVPSLEQIYRQIESLAWEYQNIPMLSRTHGQPASPTTVGKEFVVYAKRLIRQLDQIKGQSILVKLNGATGNYNAHTAAYPDIDWRLFSEEFICGFNGDHTMLLQPNLYTTQIEPHDSWAELFDALRRVNVILLDFCQDMWRYISDGWLAQKVNGGEVGSSTMPHKINPIDFEQGEGNLGLGNALFSHFSVKLPISRLQRDLSDSTVERNFGSAFGYCLVGYDAIGRGLNKIAVNENMIRSALIAHPEVIAEAIQTILRREGISAPYEQLKKLTRGRQVSMEDLNHFITNLPVSEEIKQELLRITPQNYIGMADRLC